MKNAGFELEPKRRAAIAASKKGGAAPAGALRLPTEGTPPDASPTPPFHRPTYGEQDERALVNCLRSGRIVGDGDCTRRASEKLAEILKTPHVLLTPSCTHAMELAMLTLRLQPGDEVILPSFTFVSSANCVLRAGGRVVFADIVPDTLTLDPADLARKLGPRTRAIIPVVYAGVSPDMDAITAALRGRPIDIVEDAAQGLGASYHNRPVGTIGSIGCFSFNGNKIITTGGGRAVRASRARASAPPETTRGTVC